MGRITFSSGNSFFVTALAIAFFCAAGWATDGTQLTGIGALQEGTAGAGVASPQDMTWVLLNPASIIDLGSRLDVNLGLFAPERYNDPKGLFGSHAGDMSDEKMFPIPSMGYNRSCGHGEYAWGLGLYGVGGMGVDYNHPRSWWPRLFLKNYDRRTEYSAAQFAFAFAHTIGDTGWSVGIAPKLNYARFRSDMLTLHFAKAENGYDWDDAYGVGFSIGVYKHWKKLAIGGAYSSPQWMTEFHKYEDLFFDRMDMPQMIQVGASYDILPNLDVDLDYKWLNWSGVPQIGTQPLQGGFGWDDQHIVKLGLTWYATPKWSFRIGGSHGNSPIDKDHVFADALFPAVTENHAAFGVSYRLNDKSDIHVTYTHAFENKLKDSGKGDLFSVLGKGSEISLYEDELTFEYSYRFKCGGHEERRGDEEDNRNGKNKSGNGEGKF
jgi:long-chain fatty acid transport protein